MSRPGPGRGRERLLVALLIGLSGVASVLRRAPAAPAPQERLAGPSGGRTRGSREPRTETDEPGEGRDTAPGDETAGRPDIAAGLRGYLFGLAFAALLTAVSFTIARSGLVWEPGVPVALVVFAIAQMGVHLVFFLHITTSPDSTNNVLALAFGTLIVILLIGGSLWIMGHLDQNMMPMEEIMKRQR